MGRFHRHPDGTLHAHDHHAPGPGIQEGVGDHSGYVETGRERVLILEGILSENDRVAAELRQDFANAGVRCLNLMSSPGAGKTTLLRRTLPALVAKHRVGVLEGDIATSLDADALGGLGASVSLLNTSEGFGGECHLDAVMVRRGISSLPVEDLDLVIVENVGNLVCPAEFDVGQDAGVMVYAITEGEDKPLKYPVMFRAVQLVLVNKIDLLPHLDFDMRLFRANLGQVNPTATVLEVSARTGEGIGGWLAWLDQFLGAAA